MQAAKKSLSQLVSPDKIIFADKIAGVAFGASVTKMYLAMEEVGADIPFAAVIIPTTAFLDMVEQFYSGMASNPEMREGLISALDSFKARVEGQGS